MNKFYKIAVTLATLASLTQACHASTMRCKFVTVTRTIKHTWSVPSTLQVPANAATCIVWMNVKSYKVVWFNSHNVPVGQTIVNPEVTRVYTIK